MGVEAMKGALDIGLVEGMLNFLVKKKEITKEQAAKLRDFRFRYDGVTLYESMSSDGFKELMEELIIMFADTYYIKISTNQTDISQYSRYRIKKFSMTVTGDTDKAEDTVLDVFIDVEEIKSERALFIESKPQRKDKTCGMKFKLSKDQMNKLTAIKNKMKLKSLTETLEYLIYKEEI